MLCNKRTIRTGILAGVIMFSSTMASGAEKLAGPIAGIVENVTDGDTLIVRAQIWLGQEIAVKVRLADVDTPELHRSKCDAELKLATKARDFVTTQTDGQVVWLRNIHHGKYAGLVVASIATQKGDLGDALLKAGLARAYKDKNTVWCPTS